MKKLATGRRTFLYLLIAAVIFILIFLSLITGKAVEWLWMRQLGYENIFWQLLFIKLGWFGLAFILVFLYFWGNLRLLVRAGLKSVGRQDVLVIENAGEITAKTGKFITTIISCVPALIFGLIYHSEWDTYLRFRWGGTFGFSDPIFGADVGFYMFRLPFYEMIQNGLTGLTFITFLLISVGYMSFGMLRFGVNSPQRRNWAPLGHVAILFLLFIGNWVWGYYLDRFELLYSTLGVVYGVGYTAYNVTRISLWIMLFASIALGVWVLLNFLKRRFRSILIGIGSYFFLYFVVIILLPGLVQKFEVEPSELKLETPYLKHNIDFTRKAFQLDKIEVKTYPGLSDLTPRQVSDHQETIQNIRLWDWRPLLQTYRQTQEMRLYYRFYEVDVDRYHTEDGYHQVELSARELAPELPEQARTWVNERLQYTHGYGLVMNFVSKIAEGGFPQYIIENIPPVSKYGLNVERPAIYFGEKTPGYRIVGTKMKEFDYPKGSENIYTSYQGKGGIPLDSYWKRVLFAWNFSDVNILLTSYLGPESRIQIWRSVQDRVRRIAPFLLLDKDPYLVLSEGKLYWIQDAYTTSDHFPYSKPQSRSLGIGLNYIRNSVKVIVDIYEGSVRFYVMDPNDPVLGVYRKAFPGVFRELGELSQDLKRHLRYPEDLFTIQADMYKTYHMTDPQVFYNREDLWTFAQEKYAGNPIPMIPYYILMRLPGQKELMYLLMTPFTPQNRDNMIAWMAANCDFPEYGKILLYQLPKERLILGPMQIEAMIDQNTLISGQLSLWDQKGSRVIRGNLIIIPIDSSFLYVEPVYLTAESTNIPQLKRIIIVSGNKVVMEPTLDQALQAVFGTAQPGAEKVSAPVQSEQLNRAREDLKEAEQAIRQGRWEDFGKAMEKLKALLGQPPERTK
ncbi:MAG: UPF0182 family protein [Thermodesulfobacteriota bacterium]